MRKKYAWKKQFIVTIDMPYGAWPSEAQKYVRDAVKCHCGGLDPKDRMFWLDRSKVTVKAIKDKK